MELIRRLGLAVAQFMSDVATGVFLPFVTAWALISLRGQLRDVAEKEFPTVTGWELIYTGISMVLEPLWTYLFHAPYNAYCLLRYGDRGRAYIIRGWWDTR